MVKSQDAGLESNMELDRYPTVWSNLVHISLGQRL